MTYPLHCIRNSLFIPRHRLRFHRGFFVMLRYAFQRVVANGCRPRPPSTRLGVFIGLSCRMVGKRRESEVRNPASSMPNLARLWSCSCSYAWVVDVVECDKPVILRHLSSSEASSGRMNELPLTNNHDMPCKSSFSLLSRELCLTEAYVFVELAGLQILGFFMS